MKTLSTLIGAGVTILGGLVSAQAQPNPIQGTPGSLFPDASPNEIRIINGVPCRTALVYGTNTRVPVECAGPIGSFPVDPGVTGSIQSQPPVGPAISGTPGALFPDAAPNEVQIINGVPCRTVLIYGTNTRVPVACAR